MPINFGSLLLQRDALPIASALNALLNDLYGIHWKPTLSFCDPYLRIHFVGRTPTFVETSSKLRRKDPYLRINFVEGPNKYTNIDTHAPNQRMPYFKKLITSKPKKRFIPTHKTTISS